MVIPITGGSDEGGRDRSDSDLNPPEAEYGRTIYCNAENLDLFEKANRRPGARVSRKWWEHTGIDWKGYRERAESAAEVMEPGTKALTDSESEADDATDGTLRGTGGGGGIPRRKLLQWSDAED